MPCYSFINEDFKDHARRVYECVKKDGRMPVLTRKFMLIVNSIEKESVNNLKYDEFINDVILIGATLHDIGKAIAHYQNGDLRSFKGHDFIGALIMYEAYRALKESNCAIQAIKLRGIDDLIQLLLIVPSLFHLYLHRGKEESWKIQDIKYNISIPNIKITNDCISAVIDVLNLVKDNASSEIGRNLTDCIINVFIKGSKVNDYLVKYGLHDLENTINMYYSRFNTTRGYNWFFESIIAIVNECDSEAAKSRR
ncbi:hypothetical protein [Vulcanisaeta distributa]|uniref:CRISPR-associated HD domain protein n=1 Tax=Vulcanisaeta distributa (strain DSM 14429 / JCM 11212 / NBRC 100878 / IC-017) TaxID=572478 RepID=E1QU69_VULDI|nr:hypothetical protein [Vulcanisaeta distributa]ADN51063.1 hypothetical protein Vdis_1689 [Vulcanisaeta distributa DSM 14429]